MKMSFRQATIAIGLVSLCFFAPQFALSEALQSAVRVDMNHAKVLRLDRPVSKVIIGNSDIADVTVADATTVVLTGKSFGSTNLVLLDADGNAIADERVLVSVDEGETVRVYRQTDRTILSCSPTCEPKSAQSATSN